MRARRWMAAALGILVLCSVAAAPAAAPPSQDDEVRRLRQQMEELTRELDRVRQRLDEVEARARSADDPTPRATSAAAPEDLVLISDGVGVSQQDRFEFRGQIRARYEFRSNPGLADRGSEDADAVLLRTRFGVRAWLTEDLSADLLFQDARLFGEEASTTSDEEGLDLKVGVLEWTNLGSGDMADLFLGRQVLSYGEQKLIGGLEWTNTARSFDAVRAVFRGADDRWRGDLFFSLLDEEFGGDDDENFSGFYNSIQLGADRNHALEPYLLYRRNGDGAAFPGGQSLDEYTLGVRAEGRVGAWLYAFEGAYQFGDRGDLDIDAWALHGRLGYQWDTPRRPLLMLEANRGTGDDDPADGDWNRFDNLFPTNHMHYGYADFFSWTNLDHWRLGFAMEPYRRGRLGFDLHRFALETTSDAWFNAGGAVVRSADPDADDDAGWELDITWRHKWDNGLALLAGWSWFEPGDFAEATGEDDETQFFYVQTLLNF